MQREKSGQVRRIRGRGRPFAIVAAVAAIACAKGNADQDAAALASAREAQIRAEAELKVMKDLAARGQTVATTPVTATSQPASSAAPQPPPPAGGVVEEHARCGCTVAACSCVSVVVSLAIDLRKPGNQDWDALGGAPDPQITIRTPSTSATSEVFKDRLGVSATFANLALSPGQSVTIDVVDKDELASDPIGTFSAIFAGKPATLNGKMAAADVRVEFRR